MANSLPPGATLLPLNEPAQAAQRIKETFSRVSPALTKLRVQHILPETTAFAQRRIQELKKLYRTPLAQLKREHEVAMAESVLRLRLTKSVRNVKIVNQGNNAGGASVVGALCMPFNACCALPCAGLGASLMVTGAVDGLVTVWDVSSCSPLASSSSCEGNQWGRVRSLAPYSRTAALEGKSLFFSTTMFDRRIGVWAVERGNEGAGPAGSWSLQRLDGTAASEEERATRHIANINQIAVDPTGALLASAGDDATLRLWDACTLAHTLSATQQQHGADGGGHSLSHLCTQDGYEGAGQVLGVAFHPDGSLVSTCDAGGRVVTWDTRTGKHAFTTLTPPTTRAAAAALGGRRGRSCVGGHLDRAMSVAWSPCGVRFASGGADAVIQLWDARMLYKEYAGASGGGTAVAEGAAGGSVIAPFQLLGHEDYVTSLSFYSDPFSSGAETGTGQRNGFLPIALVSTSLDGTVKLWDADTGLCVRTLPTGSPVYSHCRPTPIPSSHSSAGEGDNCADVDGANTGAAIVTIGHSKYWSLFDATGVGSSAAVSVQETETLVDLSGSQAVRSALAKGSSDGSNPESDDEEEEEEEDEMVSLMATRKTKDSVASSPPPAFAKAPAAEAESEDDEDDDEMEMLKKKQRNN